MIIKAVLLAALVGAAFLLIRGKPTALSLLVRRGLTLTVILLGVLSVLFPDTLTDVAETIGVGRGTDLVLYVLCVTFLFVTISLYLRLSQLHDKVVEIARQHALLEAEVRELRAPD